MLVQARFSFAYTDKKLLSQSNGARYITWFYSSPLKARQDV